MLKYLSHLYDNFLTAVLNMKYYEIFITNFNEMLTIK